MHRYKIYNAPMQTTAAIAKVTTGVTTKTMLQLSPPSSRQLKIVSWGFSLDAAPATTGTGMVELLQTDVAASVTAHVASGVQPLTPGLPPSLLTLGASNTGFSASVEGATTATRTFDAVQIPGLSNGGAGIEPYVYQFMPEEWSYVSAGTFLRVRATFSAAVNMITWIVWDE